MDRYLLIKWPASQELMDKPGFDANCYIADIENESGAYFVDEEWYHFVRELPISSIN